MAGFLFTDIVGSTALWEAHPEAMRDAHLAQRTEITAAVQRAAGRVVKDTGDGVLAVFEDPVGALGAAIESQRRLLARDWGEVGNVSVRMGLHYGPAPVDADGDVHGPTVNRAARVMDCGHGAQIVASGAFVDAVGDESGFAPLGRHRLRGLDGGLDLFQVVADGLPEAFPPVRTLDGMPNNLPHELTALVGRTEERQRLAELLGDARLVTIVGTGGAGKTRLALQLGSDVLDRFADGVWFVDLAGLGEGEMVAPAVAAALRIGDQPGRGWVESITRFASERELMLVIDNCEHLLGDVATLVEEVLSACRGVRVLATSREAVGVTGEVTWPIASLPTPPAEVTSASALRESDSVALFLKRARAARPDVDPGDEELVVIADICRRLDGLPLAIELAAARVRVLPVTEIASRLDDRFRFLVGGSRTAAARQRTLEAAVAWSYQLLEPDERRLFDQLSVFSGSFTLDAADHVCGDLGVDVLDGVIGLVEKSLLETDPTSDRGRYRMLETLRMFGRERLIDAGAIVDARDGMRDWARTFAEEAAAELAGPDQFEWLHTVEAEIDNLRSAMQWALESDDRASGLAIAADLHRYWFDRSVREGLTWFGRLLDQAHPPDTMPADIVGRALIALGHLLQATGDNEAALATLDEARVRLEAAGDDLQVAWARQLASRCHWGLGDLDQALVDSRQCIDAFREAGETNGLFITLAMTAGLEGLLGDMDAARQYLPELEGLSDTVASPNIAAHIHELLYAFAAVSGHPEQGVDRLHDALQAYTRLGRHVCAAHVLDAAAHWALHIDETDAGARLHGHALNMWDEAGVAVPPWERVFHDVVEVECEQTLSSDERAELFGQGAELALADALDLALRLTDRDPGSTR